MSYDTKIAIITGVLLVVFVALLVGTVARAQWQHWRRNRRR